MTMRERHRSDQDQPTDRGTDERSDGDRLGAVRQQAQDLLQAGDDAINRALSGNSESFLRNSRQASGQ
ncbi:MAG: hypothetical protein GY906_08115 [bacterium]|nr:hypothetical protein [bacterium]